MKIPKLLKEMLNTNSPSGNEVEMRQVIDNNLSEVADCIDKDSMGNRMAVLNSKCDKCTLMFDAHMDEVGLMVDYIDANGYIFFTSIGGLDTCILPGKHAIILTSNGPVNGVIGRKAVHQLSYDERQRAPKLSSLWIDIGAFGEEDANEKVSIGDSVVIDSELLVLNDDLLVSKALDDKAGCYVIAEVLKRLAKDKKKLKSKVVSNFVVQEEVGLRGSTVATYKVNPDIAVAVDVYFATDHPDCNPRTDGNIRLGGGPIITRGVNIHEGIFQRLVKIAKKKKIPFQICADSSPTGTNANKIQVSREGVATALISIPLRYMHTPVETISLEDLEDTIKLLYEFAKTVKKEDLTL